MKYLGYEATRFSLGGLWKHEYKKYMIIYALFAKLDNEYKLK